LFEVVVLGQLQCQFPPIFRYQRHLLSFTNYCLLTCSNQQQNINYNVLELLSDGRLLINNDTHLQNFNVCNNVNVLLFYKGTDKEGLPRFWHNLLQKTLLHPFETIKTTLADFCYPVYELWVFFAFKTLNYLAFKSFNFERTWWRLFQKRVVRTKYDVHVYINFY
jgi:hypothetical protein